MKVALISTKATNIGDDLIRRGVQRLLTDALPGLEIAWKVVNKHQPWTVYSKTPTTAAAIGRLPRGQRRATDLLGRANRALGGTTVFSDADLIVQCGTPVMWPGCSQSEWQRPIWEEALVRSDRSPVLNLSGGSCFPWTAPKPVQLTQADESAIRAMLQQSDLFTARDPLAGDLSQSLGTPAAVFSCAAVHSGRGKSGSERNAKALLMNIMPRGGHFDWDQHLEPEQWLRAVDHVVAARSATDEILFLCHSTDELELARSRWPSHEAVLPATTDEYLRQARRGRIALVNRMHAAVALAGLGVPAVAVGTDTRLLMVQQTGQEIVYLGDADGEELLHTLDHLDQERAMRSRSLLEREEGSFRAHREALVHSEALSRAVSMAMT